jgi:hypothetical protein
VHLPSPGSRAPVIPHPVPSAVALDPTTGSGADRAQAPAVGLAILKDLGSNDAIMGTPLFAQEQMARAVEVGLGAAGPDEIEMASDDAEGRARPDVCYPSR